MVILMSTNGPEVRVGEEVRTLREGYRAKVIAIPQGPPPYTVALEFLDEGAIKGLVGEYAPSIIGCYAITREHPGDPVTAKK
jgi:hypothetical protein